MFKIRFTSGFIVGVIAAAMIGTTVAAVFGPTPHSNGGWVVGESSAKIGFFGATPVARQGLTGTVAQTFTIIGPTAGTTAAVVTNATIDVATVVTGLTVQTAVLDFILADGTTNTTALVTNVVALTDTQGVTLQTRNVFADLTGSATNTFAAYTTTNQANAIVTGLRNLGLFANP